MVVSRAYKIDWDSLYDVQPTTRAQEIREVHVSDARMFRACRLRWKLGSVTQMNLEPKKPVAALWLGTGAHIALDAYYQPGYPNIDDCLNTFDIWSAGELVRIKKEVSDDPELVARLESDRNLVMGVLEHYCNWAPKHDEFEVLGTETKFETMLDDRTVLMGRVDMVIRDDTGRIWIMDHKLVSRIDTFGLILDEQATSYVKGVQSLGFNPEGIVFNFLRKKIPTIPRLLVRGGLSKAKNIDTTIEIYEAAIAYYGYSRAEYIDILEILRAKGNRFFHREPVRRSEQVVNTVMKRFVAIADEMENPAIYPTPEPYAAFRCKGCPFLRVCLAMEDGADWQFILKNNYAIRKKRVTVESLLEEGV